MSLHPIFRVNSHCFHEMPVEIRIDVKTKIWKECETLKQLNVKGSHEERKEVEYYPGFVRLIRKFPEWILSYASIGISYVLFLFELICIWDAASLIHFYASIPNRAQTVKYPNCISLLSLTLPVLKFNSIWCLSYSIQHSAILWKWLRWNVEVKSLWVEIQEIIRVQLNWVLCEFFRVDFVRTHDFIFISFGFIRANNTNNKKRAP